MISKSHVFAAIEQMSSLFGNNEKNVSGAYDALCTALIPFSNETMDVLLTGKDYCISAEVLEEGYYRSLRSFMRWAWSVYNFNSTCPTDISKVKSPPVNPIPGIPESAVRDMLAEAEKTEYPMRDVAFIMFLVDTGVRKQEAANVKIKDVDLITGDVFVEYGKGRNNRTVHIGNKTRKAITKYLTTVENDRPDDSLWVSKDGYSMTLMDLLKSFAAFRKISIFLRCIQCTISADIVH